MCMFLLIYNEEETDLQSEQPHGPHKMRAQDKMLVTVFLTFSSRALWCSNKDFSALRTSTSLETPAGD